MPGLLVHEGGGGCRLAAIGNPRMRVSPRGGGPWRPGWGPSTRRASLTSSTPTAAAPTASSTPANSTTPPNSTGNGSRKGWTLWDSTMGPTGASPSTATATPTPPVCSGSGNPAGTKAPLWDPTHGRGDRASARGPPHARRAYVKARCSRYSQPASSGSFVDQKTRPLRVLHPSCPSFPSPPSCFRRALWCPAHPQFLRGALRSSVPPMLSVRRSQKEKTKEPLAADP